MTHFFSMVFILFSVHWIGKRRRFYTLTNWLLSRHASASRGQDATEFERWTLEMSITVYVWRYLFVISDFYALFYKGILKEKIGVEECLYKSSCRSMDRRQEIDRTLASKTCVFVEYGAAFMRCINCRRSCCCPSFLFSNNGPRRKGLVQHFRKPMIYIYIF